MERRARNSPDLTHAPALPDPKANRALISSMDPARAPCHAQMLPLTLVAASEDLNLALSHLPLPTRNRDINSWVKRDSEVALPKASRSQASASLDQDQPRVLALLAPSLTAAHLAQGLLPRR